jgi:hypothetical protein
LSNILFYIYFTNIFLSDVNAILKKNVASFHYEVVRSYHNISFAKYYYSAKIYLALTFGFLNAKVGT